MCGRRMTSTEQTLHTWKNRAILFCSPAHHRIYVTMWFKLCPVFGKTHTHHICCSSRNHIFFYTHVHVFPLHIVSYFMYRNDKIYTTKKANVIISNWIISFEISTKNFENKKNNHSHSQQSHTGGLCYEWNSKHKQIDIYMSVRNSNSCWYVHFRYFCAHQRKLMCIFQFDSWM